MKNVTTKRYIYHPVQFPVLFIGEPKPSKEVRDVDRIRFEELLLQERCVHFPVLSASGGEFRMQSDAVFETFSPMDLTYHIYLFASCMYVTVTRVFDGMDCRYFCGRYLWPRKTDDDYLHVADEYPRTWRFFFGRIWIQGNRCLYDSILQSRMNIRNHSLARQSWKSHLPYIFPWARVTVWMIMGWKAVPEPRKRESQISGHRRIEQIPLIEQNWKCLLRTEKW